MSLSTRSDNSLSSSSQGPQSTQGQQTQGQTSNHGLNQDPEAALHQISSERNSLRSQNDQLWKIIEKQRIIIQNLQKDLAKAVSERELLRNHLTSEHSTLRSNSLNSLSNLDSSSSSSLALVNGHHQLSKRSLEKKSHPDKNPSSSDSQAQQPPQHHHQPHHQQQLKHPFLPENTHQDNVKPVSENTTTAAQAAATAGKDAISQEATTTALTKDHHPRSDQTSSLQDPVQLTHSDQAHADILTPTRDDDSNAAFVQGTVNKDAVPEEDQQQSSATTMPETDPVSRSSYDAEIQTASTANRIQGGSALASPAIVLEHDQFQPNAGQYHSPSSSTATSPANSRNVSANLFSQHMPHLPPRSPRRERRDMGDNTPSPAASDNEDDAIQSPVSRRKLAAAAARVRGEPQLSEQTSPLALSQGGSVPSEPQDEDVQIASATKISAAQGGALHLTGTASKMEPEAQKPNFLVMGKATRKNISAQIPLISSVGLGPSKGSMELSPASPSTATSSISTPTSPIAAIIDQDAEKFRMYMNKLNSPNRRNISAPIQVNSEKQDLASALGQAVAMENIQNQIEIQNQLMGQVQGHGGRGLNPVKPPSQSAGRLNNNVSAPIVSQESFPKTSADYGDVSDQGTLADTMERNSSQLSLPSDTRSKRRDSSLHLADETTRILSRSTSHQRDDDESSFTNHGAPLPLRRFDSQGLSDQSHGSDSGRPMRAASPTPSANSSLANTVNSAQPPLSHSRSAPTFHQQAFSMFADNLEFVSVLVVGSNIKSNDRGKELLTFLISIGQEIQGLRDEAMCPHKENDELWRVEKQYADFVSLDAKLRVTQSRNIINSLPKLPEKGLFNNHAPSKVDARKVALEQYLQQITSLRIKDTRDLCEFLSTNVVERESAKKGRDAGWKEGYLTKRGKNFGGWKTRYFILKGPVLEYLDSKDGHHLGNISLTNAQIGRQQTPERSHENSGDGSVDPNSYRHAFLILEPKKGQTVLEAKKNPSNVIRHVLCAETDLDRDQWVDALMVYVGKDPSESSDSTDRERSGKKLPEIQKLGATPIRDPSSSKGNEKLSLNQEAYDRPQLSAPPSLSHQHVQGRGGNLPQSPTLQSGSINERQSAERPSNENYNPPQYLPRNNPSTHSLPQEEPPSYKQSPESQSGSPFMTSGDPAEKKQKSRLTFWPKKKEETSAPMPNSTTSGQHGSQPTSTTSPSQHSQDSSRLKYFLGKSSSNTANGSGGSASNVLPPSTSSGPSSYPSLAPIRQVFGVPLEQAIEQARVQPGYELPAVVYRCIEYLNAHRAKMEEGIYRLNGSTAVIKNLKEQFNHEGDVQLLACEDYYDIHAVAGLLKLYLRDLPSSVLTRELHKDFLQVVELSSRGDRVDELTRLVASLPEANYTILRALTAHLIEIVDNADVNKMTARNVGIVFSPTLGIPAGVFSLLMSDFDLIFHTSDGRIMPLENSDLYGVNAAPDTSFDSMPAAPLGN